MAISVTEFKHRCLEIIRRVEATKEGVAITRRGRIIARLQPSQGGPADAKVRPWQRLRGTAKCLFDAAESVASDRDFEALR